MCRERPGPRCSDTGERRFNRALTHFTAVSQRYEAALLRADGDPSRVRARLRKQMSKAQNRLNAAQQVYWATPRGQALLRERVESYQDRLDTQFPSGEPDSSNRVAHLRWSNLNNSIVRDTNRIDEGIARRASGYADLHMVKGERRVLRQQATVRGGHLGPNAHPLTPERAAALRESLTASGVKLREWGVDEVARAGNWVEHGSDTGFVEHATARTFRVGRDEEGNRIEVGNKVPGVAPLSRLMRVNSPDGQVVEGRHEVFVTQNQSGKYVVSVRSRAVASWEDAAPIDQTKQDLGHLISSTAPSRAVESKHIHAVSDTLEGAIAKRDEAVRIHRSAQVTAAMGRDSLVSRAGRRSLPLQRRGIVVWHRYVDPQGRVAAS